MDDPLSPGWRAFARLQRSIECDRFATGDSLADEEALSDLAAEFDADVEPSADDVARRFHSLRRNRRRKHRCRRRLREAVYTPLARALSREDGTRAERTVAIDDETRWARSRVTELDWRIFLRLAVDETAEHIAATCGISPGALRVRISRSRARLRAVA